MTFFCFSHGMIGGQYILIRTYMPSRKVSVTLSDFSQKLNGSIISPKLPNLIFYVHPFICIWLTYA